MTERSAGAGHAAARQDGARPPGVLVLGHGAVGRAIAARLAERTVPFAVCDPLRAGTDGPVRVLAEPPSDLSDVALVLAAVPAAAAVEVARRLAALPGAFVHVDLSSSPPPAMADAARAFDGRPARFVDGAIMGAVDLHGADAPVILAGAAAEEAARLMHAAGLPGSAMPGSRPGEASGLKLLRSLLTKGIEALAVEAFLAARRLGLSGALRDNLADVSRTPFPDFLDSLVRTHPVHAVRRAAEMEAAVAALEEEGLPAEVSRAVLERFRLTAERIEREGPPEPATVSRAVDWLAGGETSGRGTRGRGDRPDGIG